MSDEITDQEDGREEVTRRLKIKQKWIDNAIDT